MTDYLHNQSNLFARCFGIDFPGGFTGTSGLPFGLHVQNIPGGVADAGPEACLSILCCRSDTASDKRLFNG